MNQVLLSLVMSLQVSTWTYEQKNTGGGMEICYEFKTKTERKKVQQSAAAYQDSCWESWTISPITSSLVRVFWGPIRKQLKIYIFFRCILSTRVEEVRFDHTHIQWVTNQSFRHGRAALCQTGMNPPCCLAPLCSTNPPSIYHLSNSFRAPPSDPKENGRPSTCEWGESIVVVMGILHWAIRYCSYRQRILKPPSS